MSSLTDVRTSGAPRHHAALLHWYPYFCHSGDPAPHTRTAGKRLVMMRVSPRCCVGWIPAGSRGRRVWSSAAACVQKGSLLCQLPHSLLPLLLLLLSHLTATSKDLQGARRRGKQWYPTTHARRRARATRNNRPAALLLHPPMCTELVGCPPGPEVVQYRYNTTRRRHVSCGGGGTIALSTLLAPATSAVSSPRAHTPRRGNTAGPQRQATVRTHGVTHLYPSITLRQRQQQTQQQVVATTTAAANDLRL